jgi:hypothetical protein
VTFYLEDSVVAEEPVYAPDQLKPGKRKSWRIGAVISAVILLGMTYGNHEGNTENVWLVLLAVALLAALLADPIMRRSGLKADDQK